MIGYITLGTNDLEKYGKFYDELLAIIGATRFMADDHIILWGTKPGQAMFSLITPNDGKAATVGNGTMAAFKVDNLDIIKQLHTKSIELGGTDEGEPGPRGETLDFGYVRDLEGNKLAFFCTKT